MSDNWDYPQVNIDVDVAGYANQDIYYSGWNVELLTDLTGFAADEEPSINFYTSSSNNISIGGVTGDDKLEVVTGNLDISTGNLELNDVVRISNAGAFTGTGANITSLNASNISTGTLSDARLSSNVALLDNAQTFTGIKDFSGGTGSAYSTAGLEIYESNASGTSPRISFHLGGSVASQFGYLNGDTSGDLSVLDNPGTGYETLRARDYKVGTTQFIDSSRNIVNGAAATFAGLVTANGGIDLNNNDLDDVQSIYFDESNSRIYDNANGLIFDGGDGTADFLIYDNQIYSDQIQIGYAGTALISTYDANEDLTVDPNGTGDIILVPDGSDGNVGIGTTTPSTKLDINGDFRIAGQATAADTFMHTGVFGTSNNCSTAANEWIKIAEGTVNGSYSEHLNLDFEIYPFSTYNHSRARFSFSVRNGGSSMETPNISLTHFEGTAGTPVIQDVVAVHKSGSGVTNNVVAIWVQMGSNGYVCGGNQVVATYSQEWDVGPYLTTQPSYATIQDSGTQYGISEYNFHNELTVQGNTSIGTLSGDDRLEISGGNLDISTGNLELNDVTRISNAGAFTGTTIDTGNGAMEVNTIAAFLGDQNLRVADSPNFTNLDIVAGNDNGIRFWNGNANYAITMGNDQNNHGTVTDYSIHHNIGTTAGRGFTFGSSDTAVSFSINALTGDLNTSGDVTVQGGDLSIVGDTNFGVYYSDASDQLQVTAAGTTGQCLNANTGAAPTWGSCTGSGGSKWTESGSNTYLTSSGNSVGIGTSTPSGLLEVSAGTSGDAGLYITADTDNNNEADNPYIYLSQDGGGFESVIGHVGATNEDPLGSTYTGVLSDSLLIATHSLSGSLVLGTNDNARLTIRQDGDIGIGTNSPTGRLQVTGDEVRIGNAGSATLATADGDLYVEDALEVDGDADFGGHVALGSSGAVDAEHVLHVEETRAYSIQDDDLVFIDYTMNGAHGTNTTRGSALEVDVTNAKTGTGVNSLNGVYAVAQTANDTDSQIIVAIGSQIQAHDTDDIAYGFSTETFGASTAGTHYGVHINVNDNDTTDYGLYIEPHTESVDYNIYSDGETAQQLH